MRAVYTRGSVPTLSACMSSYSRNAMSVSPSIAHAAPEQLHMLSTLGPIPDTRMQAVKAARSGKGKWVCHTEVSQAAQKGVSLGSFDTTVAPAVCMHGPVLTNSIADHLTNGRHMILDPSCVGSLRSCCHESCDSDRLCVTCRKMPRMSQMYMSSPASLL